MIRAAGIPDALLDKVPILAPKDVADAIVYALSTPAHVQVLLYIHIRITLLVTRNVKPRVRDVCYVNSACAISAIVSVLTMASQWLFYAIVA